MIKGKNISIGLKIGLGFFILGLVLLTILFILLIPKIEKEQYNNALRQTQRMVVLTKYQIHLVVDYLQKHSHFEKEKAQNEIINILDKIKIKSQTPNYEDKNQELESIASNYNCSIELISSTHSKYFKNEKVNQIFPFQDIQWNQWKNIDPSDSFCPHPTFLLYKTHLHNEEVQLTCSSAFKNTYQNIEEKVKKIVQEGFSLTHNIHKGKVYIMWINNNIEQESFEKPIHLIDNVHNKNYCVSKISNFRLPQTGELAIKEILNVEDTQYFEHQLEGKDTLTWISKIYQQNNKSFIFVLSAFEEDFKKNISNPIHTILPISILSLLISVLLGWFLVKRWIKNIEVLSQTARKICLGKTNLRSHIKGNDDIGVLGVAFDSMLDTLEENIKNLDSKVENRTMQLSKLLKTKEILLKEIHHRVKNNLALTINFIKLQKDKIDDESTVYMLTKIENRIHTMALLHTKLYESEDLNSIHLKKYITELVFNIASSFDISKNVSIECHIDDVILDIDYALPCGLIINETVTNAMKYAFTNQVGQLHIFLEQNQHEYILKISDNGIGLCHSFNLEDSKTLGLRLIYLITTTQLNGTVKYYNDKGLHFIITFPKE